MGLPCFLLCDYRIALAIRAAPHAVSRLTLSAFSPRFQSQSGRRRLGAARVLTPYASYFPLLCFRLPYGDGMGWITMEMGGGALAMEMRRRRRGGGSARGWGGGARGGRRANMGKGGGRRQQQGREGGGPADRGCFRLGQGRGIGWGVGAHAQDGGGWGRDGMGCGEEDGILWRWRSRFGLRTPGAGASGSGRGGWSGYTPDLVCVSRPSAAQCHAMHGGVFRVPWLNVSHPGLYWSGGSSCHGAAVARRHAGVAFLGDTMLATHRALSIPPRFSSSSPV
jgi:hypothetical protein